MNKHWYNQSDIGDFSGITERMLLLGTKPCDKIVTHTFAPDIVHTVISAILPYTLKEGVRINFKTGKVTFRTFSNYDDLKVFLCHLNANAQRAADGLKPYSFKKPVVVTG